MTNSAAVTLTKQGITAQRDGDTPGATRLLIQAVQTDPAYEMAWLWLASCLSTPGEKRYSLDQALLANPQSAPAQKGIAALGGVQSVQPAALAGAEIIAPPAATWIVPSPAVPVRTPDQERQYIERSIASFTRDGWLVVSQTDRAVQFRKPKVWSAGGTVVMALLAIGGFLLWYPLIGLAIVVLLLLCADYIGKKEQLHYLTIDSAREQDALERRRKDAPFVEYLTNGGTVCSSCRMYVRKDATSCKHCKVQLK